MQLFNRQISPWGEVAACAPVLHTLLWSVVEKQCFAKPNVPQSFLLHIVSSFTPCRACMTTKVTAVHSYLYATVALHIHKPLLQSRAATGMQCTSK
jgi:hypothetical protein